MSPNWARANSVGLTIWSYQWVGPGARSNGKNSGVKSIRHSPSRCGRSASDAMASASHGPGVAHTRRRRGCTTANTSNGSSNSAVVYFPSMPECREHAEPCPAAAYGAPTARLEQGAIAGQPKGRP